MMYSGNAASDINLEGKELTGERLVLPSYMSPRVFMTLWLTLLLFIAAAAGVLFIKVPIYATGTGILTRNDSRPGSDGRLVVLGFLPSKTVPLLSKDQQMLVQVGKMPSPRKARIVMVEPVSPESDLIRRHFPAGLLNTSSAAELALIIGSLEQATEHDDEYYGAQVTIQVEVGTRRVGRFMPAINRFF